MNPFDWSRYAVGGAASRPDSFTKLNPDYAARVAQMLQAADAELGPRALTITSAYRSPEVQARLYQQALAKYGSEKAARKWVAPPGKSRHNYGLAVDLANSQGSLLRDAKSREAQWIAQNAARFGLSVPMSWEPWQVELAGSRGKGNTMAPAMVRGGAGQTSLLGQAGGDTLSPAAEPEKRRGLLGFLGDEDRRARLAIALEGMTLNPNTALVSTLQEGIKGRREDKRINATAQWLKSRGRDDLAEAMAAGGLSPTDAVRIAMTPEPQAEQTALMQNVQWLMSQGIPMDRALEMARGGTTVNVGGEGPQPQLVGTGGLVAIPDPSQPSGFRTEVLPGSQLALEREKAARDVASETRKALQREEKGGLYKSEVVRAAEEAISMMDKKGALDILPEAGIVGSRLAEMGVNQEAVNLKRTLETVQSGVAFDRLQTMRDMSATGGALGAVTERELALLMSSIGALSQDLSKDVLKKNLENVARIMSKIEADPIASAAYRGQAAPSAPEPQGQRRLKFNPATGELE